MKQQRMVRRAAMAAGILIATSLGLAQAGTASAATPALHVKDGSKWTMGFENGGCEIQTFSSHGSFTFVSDLFGDHGTWSAAGDSLTMKWTGGSEAGWKFKGTYNVSTKAYFGNLGGTAKGLQLTAILDKGASTDGC